MSRSRRTWWWYETKADAHGGSEGRHISARIPTADLDVPRRVALPVLLEYSVSVAHVPTVCTGQYRDFCEHPVPLPRVHPDSRHGEKTPACAPKTPS